MCVQGYSRFTHLCAQTYSMQDKAGHYTRAQFKPTMLASSVQAVVAYNTTVLWVCTSVLFIVVLCVCVSLCVHMYVQRPYNMQDNLKQDTRLYPN